jgi:cell division septation protein DedD
VPRNDDGEFELILGNRQLLSVFFIVVILLGVFFTMGYIVGRNSAPVTAADSGTPRRAESKPLVVDSAVPPSQESAPAKEAPAVGEPASAQPVSTQPQQPAAEKKEPAKEAKKEPARREPPETAKTSAAPAGGPSGTYLQLAATNKREAEIMVDVLKRKEFKAITAEIAERPGMFRVLVGPVSEADLNKTRADLQGAGFPGNAAIKRTF